MTKTYDADGNEIETPEVSAAESGDNRTGNLDLDTASANAERDDAADAADKAAEDEAEAGSDDGAEESDADALDAQAERDGE